mmetsp:Transcript_26095/g.41383  ORF Transcript_26095/g.41383 Transcript_26095/m.41383 type:complete len:92 (-) Transcript_26095:512-787(-)
MYDQAAFVPGWFVPVPSLREQIAKVGEKVAVHRDVNNSGSSRNSCCCNNRNNVQFGQARAEVDAKRKGWDWRTRFMCFTVSMASGVESVCR